MNWKDLLKNVLISAGDGALGGLKGGADWKTTGIIAGISALAGLLGGLTQHVTTQQPATKVMLSKYVTIEPPVTS